jgi:hypothetical protein
MSLRSEGYVLADHAYLSIRLWNWGFTDCFLNLRVLRIPAIKILGKGAGVNCISQHHLLILTPLKIDVASMCKRRVA